MTKLIAIDASPNSTSSDVSLATKLLFSPFSWGEDKYLKKVEDYFNENYKPELTLVTGSGRAALYLLLKSVIQSGDEVITQAFTCLAVPNAILWAGGKPVFVDIERETYNIEVEDLKKKITKKTKAVILQHTFGIPANTKEIKALCVDRGIFLLEDCAHSLGAKVDSKLVGSLGDGAIFSFNQDKVVSGVSGGALIINNPDLTGKLDIKLSPAYGGRTFRSLLHPILWGLATPIYETLFLGKALIFAAWKTGILRNTITPSEEMGKMPVDLLEGLSEPQAQLIFSGLQRLEKDNQRRVEIAKRYKDSLGDLVTHPDDSKGAIYMRYPILVEDSIKLVRAARKSGIILGRWYKEPIFPWTPAASEVYEIGECPVAEEVGKRVVNLPTYPRLSDEDVDRVIKAVKIWLDK